VLIESVLIEPGDVKIASDAAPEEIINKVFGGTVESSPPDAERRTSASKGKRKRS
jgi:hypothetical protein